MAKSIAIIPIRRGSKSIQNKNVRNFNGKPLVHWVLEYCFKSGCFDEIIVATDYQKSEIYKQWPNWLAHFQRSEESALDTASTEEVVIEYLQLGVYNDDDLITLVQCTNPLWTPAELKAGMETFRSSGIARSLVTCTAIKRFFWSESGHALNYNYDQRPRRQEFQNTLVENGAFYITRCGDFLKNKNRITPPVITFCTSDSSFYEIDEPTDWIIAEAIHSQAIQPEL